MKKIPCLKAFFLGILCLFALSGEAFCAVQKQQEGKPAESKAVSAEGTPITPYVAPRPLTEKEMAEYKKLSFSEKMSFLWNFYVENKKRNVTDGAIIRELMRLDDEGGLVSLFSDLKGKLKSWEAGYYRTVDEINQGILKKYPGKTEYMIDPDDKGTWKNIRYLVFNEHSLDDFLKEFDDDRFYSEIYTAPYGQFRLAACANLSEDKLYRKDGKKVTMALIALMSPGYRILRQVEGQPFIPVSLAGETSTNLKILPLEYPLTSIFNVKENRAYGYAGKILFPFQVEFNKAGEAADLSLSVTMDVCEEGGECRTETTAPLKYSFTAGPFLETPVCPSLREALLNVPSAGLSGLELNSAGFKEGTDGNVYLFAKFKIPVANLDIPALHIANTSGLKFEKPFYVGNDGYALFRSKVLNPERLREIGQADLVLTTFNLNRASAFPLKLSVRDAFNPDEDVTSLMRMVKSFFTGILFNFMTPFYMMLSLFLYQMLFIRNKSPEKTLLFARGLLRGLLLFLVLLSAGLFTVFVLCPSLKFVWGRQLGSPLFNVFLTAVFLTAPAWMKELFDDKKVEERTARFSKLFVKAEIETPRERAGFLVAFSAGVLSLFSPMLGMYFNLYDLVRPNPVIYGICFALGLALPFLAILPCFLRAAELPVRKIRLLSPLLFLQAYVHAFLLWIIVGSESGRWVFLGVPAAICVVWYVFAKIGKTEKIKKRLALGLTLVALVFVPFRPNELSFTGYATAPFDEKVLEDAVKDGKAVFVNVSEEACLACQYNKLMMLWHGGDLVIREGKLIIMTASYDTPYLKELLANSGTYSLPMNLIFGPSAPQGMLLPSILRPITAGIVASEMFRFAPY